VSANMRRAAARITLRVSVLPRGRPMRAIVDEILQSLTF
jgi:hypothetical protein